MINIKLKCDTPDVKGAQCILTMDGHANYSDGNDIVCSAASAIVYSLLGFLDNFYPGNFSLYMTSGHLELVVKDYKEDLITAFEVVHIGLEQIAFQYPKNVNIELI
nr:MAG TPA: YsxB-like protein [Caudoviricetes sp.]